MECIVFQFLFSFKALGYQMPLSLTLVLSYAALNILYLMSQGKTLKQYADMASQGDKHPLLLRARLAPPTTTEIDTASAQVYEAREKAEAVKAAAADVAPALANDFPFSSAPALEVASGGGAAAASADTLEIDPAQNNRSAAANNTSAGKSLDDGIGGGGYNSAENRSTSRSREDDNNNNNDRGQQQQRERRTSTAAGGSRKGGHALKSGRHTSRSSSRSSARRGSSRSTFRRRSKSSSSSIAAAAAAAAAAAGITPGTAGGAGGGNDGSSSGKKALPFGCFGAEGFGWGSDIVPLRAREMWLEKPAGQFGSFPVQVLGVYLYTMCFRLDVCF